MLLNTKRPFWNLWRTNTMSNIDMSHSLNPNAYRPKISFSPPWLQDPINYSFMHRICAGIMKYTYHQTVRLKPRLDKAIALQAYRLLPGSIRIHLLNHQRTGGTFIWISIITTPTQWRLAVYFDAWHIQLVAQTIGNALIVNRSLYNGKWCILHHTTWCRRGGQSVPWAKCHKLEAVKNHIWDRWGKAHCKAVCSSLSRDTGKWWPGIGYKEYRKQLGKEERGGVKDKALNGQSGWFFRNVAGQQKSLCYTVGMSCSK